MNKKDIIDEVVSDVGFNRAETEQIINTFLERIHMNIKAGHPVRLMGFGSFIKSKRRAKVGTDPNTQRRTLFKAKGWPKFIPSQRLKKAVE